MSTEIIRLRAKNQLTLPASLRKKLDLEEGDFFVVVPSDGEIVLRPTRLPRFGSMEGDLEDQFAEKDIEAGRYQTEFDLTELDNGTRGGASVGEFHHLKRNQNELLKSHEELRRRVEELVEEMKASRDRIHEQRGGTKKKAQRK